MLLSLRISSLHSSCCVWLCAIFCFASLQAEDVVVVAATKRGDSPMERHGTILDFTGDGLILAATADSKTTISAERVLEIRSRWQAEELTGDEAWRKGDLTAAVRAYEAALNTERRPWALRKLQQKLMACHEWNDQPEQACELFLELLKQDSLTPYYASIPLAWKNRAPNAEIVLRAKTWLQQKSNPVAQLLGASWLVQSPEKSQALKILTELAGDLDSRVAPLAVAQLWRTKLTTATSDDLALWQQLMQRVPEELRAGPLLLIGDLQLRLKQPEDAALSYLQAALGKNTRDTVAVEGLFAAAKIMEQQSRPKDAAQLYRELLMQHAVGAGALNVAERLKALAGAASR